jgi:high-affinity iron transporter
MLAALVIVFREVLEAGLIIGVVLAASRGVSGRGRAVAMGILAGIAGSAVVAAFAAQISSAFEGRGQELFTAGVLMLAVVMLAWHVVWMAEHAREMTARLRQLGEEVALGSRSVAMLAIVVGLAVMREGSEVVLFLTGILMQGSDGLVPLVLGSAGGLALGAAVSAVVYLGLAAVPFSRVFAVTGVLVTLLAAGLAAQAVHQLSNAGLLNVLDGTLWDTTWLLSEDSWPGRVLHVLIGYMDRPTLMQAIAYVATVVAILGLSTARRAPEARP